MVPSPGWVNTAGVVAMFSARMRKSREVAIESTFRNFRSGRALLGLFAGRINREARFGTGFASHGAEKSRLRPGSIKSGRKSENSAFFCCRCKRSLGLRGATACSAWRFEVGGVQHVAGRRPASIFYELHLASFSRGSRLTSISREPHFPQIARIRDSRANDARCRTCRSGR